MFRTTTTTTLCMAAMAAWIAPAFAAEWMTDFDAAKAKAKAEGKSVLVNFTGSDWCQWCILMKKNVFATPGFDQYARDKFVLMEVDVPENPDFDRNLRRRNEALCEQYRVETFPTIMVMTPEGDVVGGFSSAMQSLSQARGPLDAALANAAALKSADKLKGEAKMKALYAVYNKIPEEFRAQSSLRARIAELDTRNLTGMQDEVKAQEQMDAVKTRLKDAGQDADKLLSIVEDALKNAHPKNRAALLEIKAGIQVMSAQTVDDVLAAKKTLLEMADAIPEKAATIRSMVEQRFADPARVLQNVRLQRGR